MPLCCLWRFGSYARLLQLNSLFLTRSAAAVSTDRPINVEGSPAASAFCSTTTTKTRGRAKIIPPANRLRKRNPQRRLAYEKNADINPAEMGDVRGLLPPFFGKTKTAGGAVVLSSTRCSRANADGVNRKESAAVPEERSALFLHQPFIIPVEEEKAVVPPPPMRGCALPTVREENQPWLTMATFSGIGIGFMYFIHAAIFST